MERTNTYLRVLEAQRRRLGDYEQIHFRKSWARTAYETVRHNDSTPGPPVLQPQVLEFSRATAKPYLQQTESLWMKLDLSRQSATEELLDKKIGSFYIRASSKSKYALSVRLDNAETPVMHYLIYCNAQGFYGIQGSNLQFVSLYDMLAYFCFQQSGGMPCLLSPPIMRDNKGFYISDSETDSEEDEAQDEDPFSPETETFPDNSKHPLTSHLSTVPPPLPPRPQKTRNIDPFQHYERAPFDLRADNESSLLVDRSNDDLVDSPEKPDRSLTHDDEATPPLVNRSYKNFEILSLVEDMPSSRKSLVVLSNQSCPQLRPPPLPPKTEKPQVYETPPAIPPRPAPPPIPPRSRRNTDHSPLNERKWAGEEQQGLRVRGHRRAASDSSVLSGQSEDQEGLPLSSPAPPPLPPRRKEKETETSFTTLTNENAVVATPTAGGGGEKGGGGGRAEGRSVKIDSINDIVTDDLDEWTMVEPQLTESVSSQRTPSTSASTPKAHPKWKKPRWTKRLKKWRRKPRGRLKHFILDLAEDKNSEFGARVHYFLETIVMKGNEPHQKLLSDVRQFVSRMRELLLDEYRVQLLSHGMDSCRNFEHLLEATLQQCITHPLHKFLFDKVKESLVAVGSYGQLEEAVENARKKTPEELGLRAHLLVPNDKSLSEIKSIFEKLKQTHCAMRKLEYLLEAVRLTYEGVKDVNNPKKIMNDLGADDFLPLFVWVLAHSGFVSAEIEAEYVWGLAHPSLFNGEGGYYLTTLTSAVNVLRELCSETYNAENLKTLPKTSSLKSELQVYSCLGTDIQKLDGPLFIPVLPTMTASEICELLASRFNITDHEKYELCTSIGDQITPLKPTDCPQEITIDWELETPDGGGGEENEKKLIFTKRVNR